MQHNNWRTFRFDQIADNIAERVEPAEADTDIYVGLEHLDPDSLRLRRWGTPADVEGTKLRFYPGDVIFGRRRAYQRKLAVAEFEGICSAHAMVLRARPDVCLPEFLPFFLQSDRFFERAMAISVGSLSPTINWKTLAVQEFALPPLDEQRRIAEILWAAEEVVQQWRRLSDAIEQTKIATRRSLFEESKGWTTCPLGHLFEVQLGKMVSPKSRLGKNPTPYLSNMNVQWGRFDLTNVNVMDFEPDEIVRLGLRPGDLLVCEGGEVGKAAIWQGQIEPCCYQKALHRLRPRDNKLAPQLMLQFLMYAADKGLLNQLTGQSTIAHLTAVKLRTLSVPVPPTGAQREMMQKFEALEMASEALTLHGIHSRQILRSLSAALLSNVNDI